MDKPSHEHLMVAFRTLKYLKGSLRQGVLMILESNLKIHAYFVRGYNVFIENSMISSKSKKHAIVAHCSVEYHSMAATCCEIVWLKSLLTDLGICHGKINEALL